MTILPTFPTAAVAALDGLNSDAYDADTNPKGFAEGGHITLFPDSTEAITVVAAYLHSLADALEDLAQQVSDDADSAAVGSGTEATLANIRAGISAFYLSIRNVYAANVPVVLTDAASIAWDMSLGINFAVTLGAAGRTLANPTNQVAGKSGILIISQDGTGGRSIGAIGSNLLWIGGEPAWPSTAGAKTIVAYFVQSAGVVLLTAGGSSAA